MTEQRMSLNDFRRMGGMTDEELETVDSYVRKLAVLRFHINQVKEGVISEYQGRIVFPDNGFKDSVSANDIWLCSLRDSGKVSYATPLIKITPLLLMNFDEDLRRDIIEGLWEKNRGGYEKDFEKLYRNEISEKVQTELTEMYGKQIAELKARISELESQAEQDRILLANRTVDIGPDTEMISLSSVAEEVCAVPDTPVHRADEEIPIRIPTAMSAPMPGFPEIRGRDTVAVPACKTVFRVKRVKEDVIFSDSFTDPKYFVHITPDCKMLVIRPHPYGSALAINRKITLKGLGTMSEFRGETELAAEFSERYDGLVVHL